MTLSIIGAGFGRTGTTSQQRALDELGLGPCYHFDEVLKNPGHDQLWLDIVNGKPIDSDAVFGDYRATVDWPGCHYWKELLAQNPEAKVLLSTRDFESWYDSATKTIYRSMIADYSDQSRDIIKALDMSRIMILEDTFQGRFEDTEFARSIYEQHHENVIRSVDPDQLLVYQVSEGWDPLCTFFDRPIPDEPFPKANTLADYLENFIS